MRLDKAITLRGLSRSEAKKALSAGRVCVNGQTEKNGARILSDGDGVTLDGEGIALKQHTHLMLNKPAGVLTATEDPHGDTTVIDLLPPQLKKRKLGPVGRLDKDVTGLVILTSDGVLAHRLISPKQNIEKQYTAQVEGRLDDSCVQAFAAGMQFKDFEAKGARLEIISASEDGSLCRVYITEGKFHQVKRMLAAVGHEVIRLKRDKIAGLELDAALQPGEWRELTDAEQAHLYRAAGMEQQ